MLDWWSVVLVHSSLARNFIAEALSGLSDATRHTFAVVKEVCTLWNRSKSRQLLSRSIQASSSSYRTLLLTTRFHKALSGNTPVLQYSSMYGVSAYLLRTRCTSGMKPIMWLVRVVLNWRSLRLNSLFASSSGPSLHSDCKNRSFSVPMCAWIMVHPRYIYYIIVQKIPPGQLKVYWWWRSNAEMNHGTLCFC